ncbi:MAG: MFS transporter [Candidatus Latescibacteria bacterium]|nr:MFS transporter [Candidatus Latescibacterota bacterium]
MTIEKQSSLTNLPALSDSSLLRYIAFTALYMAQGLPAGLMAVAIPAWLAKQGMGTAEIGIYLGIIGLPWSLKLIGGPIMDRFSFLPMGRRRPWVLSAQLGIVLSFWLMSTLTDPVHHLYWLASLGFVINFCTAFQDVAVDGLAIEVLPSDQQARANGLMWGGKIVGFSISSASGSYFLNQYGFGDAFLILSTGIIFIFIFPLFLRERPGERLLPWTSGNPSEHALLSQVTNWRDILRSLFHAVWLPMSRLTVLGFFCYAIGEGIMHATFPVLFVQELNWSDTDYSQLMATTRLAAGLSGMLLGALVVGRLGRVRTILIAGTLLVLAYITMGFSEHHWATRTTMLTFVFTKDILGVTITIAYLATCMDLCWQRVAASQFSLFMALANLGNTVGEALTGPIDAVLDYAQIFFAIAFVKVIALIFFYLVNLNTHKEHLGELESKLAS